MAEEDKNREDVFDESAILRERIDEDCPDPSMGWKVVSLLRTLKELEELELNIKSLYSSDCLKLQLEVDELDKLQQIVRDADDSHSFDRYFLDSDEKLDSEKKELAARLRSIVSVKRKIDEVPSQTELTQYELRLSELNSQIQRKHGQTRKHYDTYNALLKIKELMAKETSLLNSISLQFQNAISSTEGGSKLVNSLEEILNGTQQKFAKARRTLEGEQKHRDSLKQSYSSTVSEQRKMISSSLEKRH